ncbi:MAG: hypothetical protein K5897_05640 [Eubacterium sp.]|nr:hypothetical protein [Eubacterium sp.]
MKKNTFSCVAFLIGLALLVCGIFLHNNGTKALEWNSRWGWDISVKDGTAEPKMSNGNFMVDQAGEYVLKLEWNPSGMKAEDVKESDIGFVTGCTIMDSEAHQIYASASLAGNENPTLNLKAGVYHLDYRYLTTEEDFLNFAKTWLCGQARAKDLAQDYNFDKLQKEGTWHLDFFMNAEKQVPFSVSGMCGMFAIILGSCLMVLALVVWVKRRGLMRQKYDERQELEQGRGFRYAFFAALVEVGVVLMVESMGLLPDRRAWIFYAGSIFIGIIVYVIYCIWHDCYIALNEKRGTVMAVFGAIGAFNLVIGISSILSNGWFEPSGRFSVSVLNLMCAVMMLAVVIAGAIRSLVLRREEME